jgi:hypothetical protein
MGRRGADVCSRREAEGRSLTRLGMCSERGVRRAATDAGRLHAEVRFREAVVRCIKRRNYA